MKRPNNINLELDDFESYYVGRGLEMKTEEYIEDLERRVETLKSNDVPEDLINNLKHNAKIFLNDAKFFSGQEKFDKALELQQRAKGLNIAIDEIIDYFS